MTTTDSPAGLDRRSLFRRSAVVAAAAALGSAPFAALAAAPATAAPRRRTDGGGYGPLAPVRDQATGLELLLLPRGFEYTSFGWTNDAMTDGRPTPGAHDGMAAFPRSDGNVGLVRNHELSGSRTFIEQATYDPQRAGGTTNLVFDLERMALVQSYASLSGTIRNCAGGPTPWGTWLTCEENTSTNGANGLRHGYVFEVPSDGLSDAQPLKAMGRFNHEAVAVDPASGIVYLTEDSTPSGLYRFLPAKRGDLAAGGELQMAKIGSASRNTYTDPSGTDYGVLSWVEIEDVDPIAAEASAPGSTVQQGIRAGGAVFKRLEGAWYSEGKIVIVSTSGGPVGGGQVFELDTATQRLVLLYASTDRNTLDNPDNVCISGRGGILLCEDGGGDQYLRGLSPAGQVFDFARNNVDLTAGFPAGKSGKPGDYRGSEWCGGVFESKSSNVLFANIQSPGITFAITGPWKQGAL